MICFILLSVRSSKSYNPNHEFCGLIWVESCYFIVSFFFKIDFFLISFFNNESIKNCTS
jgi:hypothetical protein